MLAYEINHSSWSGKKNRRWTFKKLFRVENSSWKSLQFDFCNSGQITPVWHNTDVVQPCSLTLPFSERCIQISSGFIMFQVCVPQHASMPTTYFIYIFFFPLLNTWSQFWSARESDLFYNIFTCTSLTLRTRFLPPRYTALQTHIISISCSSLHCLGIIWMHNVFGRLPVYVGASMKVL